MFTYCQTKILKTNETAVFLGSAMVAVQVNIECIYHLTQMLYSRLRLAHYDRGVASLGLFLSFFQFSTNDPCGKNQEKLAYTYLAVIIAPLDLKGIFVS